MQVRQRGGEGRRRVVSRNCSQLLTNVWECLQKGLLPHGRDLSVQSSHPLVKVGFAGHQGPCSSGIACKGEPELNSAAEQGHVELRTEGLGVSDSQVESRWLSTCPSQLQPHVSGLEDGGPAWVSRSPPHPRSVSCSLAATGRP